MRTEERMLGSELKCKVSPSEFRPVRPKPWQLPDESGLARLLRQCQFITFKHLREGLAGLIKVFSSNAASVCTPCARFL